jgi:alkylhydroperoxidase family enzyme
VKIPAYSSLAAFLAHYRALKSDVSRTADDDQLLAEMSAVIATLAPEARAALDSTEDSASARRHRERAELQLRRELVARGIVAG